PTGPFARFFRNQPTFAVAIPEQEFWVKVHATNPTNVPVQLENVSLESPEGEQWRIDPSGQTTGTLKGNQSKDVRFIVRAPQNGLSNLICRKVGRRRKKNSQPQKMVTTRRSHSA